MSIGERIRQGRQAKELSQNDLARRLSTTPMTVSRWERGVAEPSLRFCKAMARVFGVTLDWLAGGVGPAPASVSKELDATGTEG